MSLPSKSTGIYLLVSVRNAAEARAALAGGADIIDVKEPTRGSLGAADYNTLTAVVRAVDQRAPVTAALGELVDFGPSGCSPIPPGVSLFKFGLAGCRAQPDWRLSWMRTIETLTAEVHPAPRPVAVVYADWQLAGAPKPAEVLDVAITAKSPALLVDTWRKSAGSLFDHWPAAELAPFVQEVRRHGLLAVLAGSLTRESLDLAARLAPDVIAVRTAACVDGRDGNVSTERVRDLAQILRATVAQNHRIRNAKGSITQTAC